MIPEAWRETFAMPEATTVVVAARRTIMFWYTNMPAGACRRASRVAGGVTVCVRRYTTTVTPENTVERSSAPTIATNATPEAISQNVRGRRALRRRGLSSSSSKEAPRGSGSSLWEWGDAHTTIAVWKRNIAYGAITFRYHVTHIKISISRAARERIGTNVERFEH